MAPAQRPTGSRQPGRQFRLLRSFSVISGIAMTIITVGTAFTYQWHQTATLFANEQTHNISLARSFANSIWATHSGYLTSVDHLDGQALRARPETQALDRLLRQLADGLPVLKVKIYNPKGLTLYSSEAKQIGESKSKDATFLKVVGTPRTNSNMSVREKFAALSGPVANVRLVESYVPITDGAGRVNIVFEVYSDITAYSAEIDRQILPTAMLTAVTFAVLYLILLLIVRRADRILNRQYGEVSSVNAQLMTEMQARADAEQVQATLVEAELAAREKADEERNSNAELQEKIANEQAELIHLLGEGLGKISRGDLSARLAANAGDTFRQIKEDFNRMASKIGVIVGRIAGATVTVHGATSEIGSGVTDLAERTEQQATALEETAASMEEMSVTVRLTANNAQEANRAATSTHNLAVSSGEIAGQAVAAMSKIEESSRQITEIVGLIEEIAFQTNILALNAAVEAARAGDAGRGFAVVANEVRALSQRSSQALKEIKNQIATSDVNVKVGVGLVKQAGNSLTEIVESVKKVAGLVAEIASASQEQSTGIDQVSKAVSNMDQLTQQNAALVEETNAVLQSAQGQVAELREAVAFFKIGTESEAAPHHAEPWTAAPAEVANPVHRQQGLLARKLGQRRAGGVAALATTPAADEGWKEF